MRTSTEILYAMPSRLHTAYDWVASAGEVDALAAMTEEQAELYADACEANATQHDVPLRALEVEALACWLRGAVRS